MAATDRIEPVAMLVVVVAMASAATDRTELVAMLVVLVAMGVDNIGSNETCEIM